MSPDMYLLTERLLRATGVLLRDVCGCGDPHACSSLHACMPACLRACMPAPETFLKRLRGWGLNRSMGRIRNAMGRAMGILVVMCAEMLVHGEDGCDRVNGIAVRIANAGHHPDVTRTDASAWSMCTLTSRRARVPSFACVQG